MAAGGDDLDAVFGLEAGAGGGLIFQMIGADLAAFVLQREIGVAGGVGFRLGDFAADPHAGEGGLQRALDGAGELADGEFGGVCRFGHQANGSAPGPG